MRRKKSGQLIRPRSVAGRHSRPEQVQRHLARCLNASQISSLAALYEPGAALVLRNGSVLIGRPAIRKHFASLLNLQPHMIIRKPRVVRTRGLAVLMASWQINGLAPNGAVFREHGRTYDVLRKQPDGTWCIVFDSPWGGSFE